MLWIHLKGVSYATNGTIDRRVARLGTKYLGCKMIFVMAAEVFFGPERSDAIYEGAGVFFYLPVTQ